MPLSSYDIDRLYRQEARRMVGFFVRRTHDPDTALDLVAETFACVVRDQRQFRGRGDDAARAWIYGIAYNLLNRWYRRGIVERQAMSRLGIERPRVGADELERLVELAGLDSERARVASALQAVPGDQRRAVELRVVEERPYDEVARELGISQQAARARVSRGLRALADSLSEAAPQPEGTHHG